ncbi:MULTISPECIES: tellurite resistance TerB family protein [Pseudomonas]|uniref:Tellurite resistance protein n=1 Tax=Pseudomonas juntendi TaxID=2666183 RepID=A0A7W2R1K9_9PSED|nr:MULTISPECIES: tellurite resistance protein [Pseudomonas]EGB96829.1 TciA [Pseudomonas sp. TJI-51]MBA6132104.1 tellurite resistance protein [Pseudomonas juntendi]MBA6150792.1 tellurite resistance protein [Pseudomonas juntendi]MBI6915824.1 tellurite resistance protein [Pseudomonas juntendi]MCK2110647.1 tellurite resistance protein [Pseudomonas juntendi]
MFGIGKKLFGAKRAVKKLESRDLMQAIVGGCLLVAAADGEISKNEAAQIDIQIRANKNLEHFGQEITTTVNLFTEQLQAGFRLGRMNIMREIADIKNNPLDAEEVFVNMITVAEGDGNISPEELKVLAEVGVQLGLRPKDFGIEA